MKILAKIKSWIPEIFCVALLALCVFVGHQSAPKITDIHYVFGKVNEEKTFPISEVMGDRKNFEVTLHYAPGFFSHSEWLIIPDDCLLRIDVNDFHLNADTIPGRCDFSGGFKLSSKQLLGDAENAEADLKFHLRNNGGPGGLSISVNPSGATWFLFLGFSFFVLAVLLFRLLRKIRMPISLSAVIVFVTLLHAVYTLNTPYSARAYDVDGHLEYVKYIAANWEIPADDKCWSCYQPPVYYSAMAPIWKAAEMVGISSTAALQWTSVFFSFIFLTLGVVCLRAFLQGKMLWAAALLWLFWPGAFLIAPRIGNDQLFFVAHAVTLASVILYANNKSPKYLLLGALSCWVAFWTKSTGAVTIAVWFMGFIIGFITRRSWKFRWPEVASLAVIAGFLAVFVWRLFFSDPLVGNADGLNGNLRIGAAPMNLLYFDLKDFLTNPYASAWRDEGGRQFLANYMAKTSLFGEFRLLDTPRGLWCATLISFSFVILAFYAFVGFWKNKFTKETFLLLFQGVLFYVAMAFLRAKIPFSCSSDFRYVYPMILSFVPFVAMGIFKNGASAKWKYAGVGTLAVFCVSSCVLMLSL